MTVETDNKGAYEYEISYLRENTTISDKDRNNFKKMYLILKLLKKSKLNIGIIDKEGNYLSNGQIINDSVKDFTIRKDVYFFSIISPALDFNWRPLLLSLEKNKVEVLIYRWQVDLLDAQGLGQISYPRDCGFCAVREDRRFGIYEARIYSKIYIAPDLITTIVEPLPYVDPDEYDEYDEYEE